MLIGADTKKGLREKAEDKAFTVTPELIRALTPMFMATVGLVIGVAALFVPTDGKNDAKWSAAFGLAGTAIAGAAGLAQSTKNESNISAEGNARVVQTQDDAPQPPKN